MVSVICPVLIVLAVFGLAPDFVRTSRNCRFAAFGAFLTALFLQVCQALGADAVSNLLPFSQTGLGWLLPTVIFTSIGAATGPRASISGRRIDVSR